MDKIKLCKTIIEQSQNMVFFGGAGVSTESGIPDFRSPDGLYHQTYDYPPETILSYSFFEQHPDLFFSFYKDKMLYLNVAPSITHQKLAQLEKQHKCSCVITQNVDGLHQKAGSTHVIELHGSVYRNYCTVCGEFYAVEDILKQENVPYCTKADCKGIIKPDVVLYEEPLDNDKIQSAIYAIQNADTLIVGGTSLQVYPAAALIQYFKGKHLIMINKTPLTSFYPNTLFLQEPLGKVFAAL